MNLYKNIPQELKNIPNWVCWQSIPDPKAHSGVKKVPINPHTGGQAQSNNPQTWADFDTALGASARFSGLGFMFGGSGCFGVDIDDREEILREYLNGEFINTLRSYAELSQSKTGIHIICRGRLPKGGRRNADNKIEMYDTGRFFVMTGDRCGGYAEISDGTERIKPLHAKYLGAGREPVPNLRRQAAAASVSDVLQTAMNSRNGAHFRALYSGDYSGYGSPRLTWRCAVCSRSGQAATPTKWTACSVSPA